MVSRCKFGKWQGYRNWSPSLGHSTLSLNLPLPGWTSQIDKLVNIFRCSGQFGKTSNLRDAESLDFRVRYVCGTLTNAFGLDDLGILCATLVSDKSPTSLLPRLQNNDDILPKPGQELTRKQSIKDVKTRLFTAESFGSSC